MVADLANREAPQGLEVLKGLLDAQGVRGSVDLDLPDRELGVKIADRLVDHAGRDSVQLESLRIQRDAQLRILAAVGVDLRDPVDGYQRRLDLVLGQLAQLVQRPGCAQRERQELPTLQVAELLRQILPDRRHLGGRGQVLTQQTQSVGQLEASQIEVGVLEELHRYQGVAPARPRRHLVDARYGHRH